MFSPSASHPLLLTYDPRKALAEAAAFGGRFPPGDGLAASEPRSKPPRYLVVDEFWLLFAPTPRPVSFAGPAHRVPDRMSDWRLLVHGDGEFVQAFWETVCENSALDLELGGLAGKDLVLVDETDNALVLQCCCTLACRHAAQTVFEAHYPELAFRFS